MPGGPRVPAGDDPEGLLQEGDPGVRGVQQLHEGELLHQVGVRLCHDCRTVSGLYISLLSQVGFGPVQLPAERAGVPPGARHSAWSRGGRPQRDRRPRHPGTILSTH